MADEEYGPAVDSDVNSDVATPPPRERRRRKVDGPFTAGRRASVDFEGDWDMDGAPKVQNAPALPRAPMFSGSTLPERREFMRRYDAYYRQCKLLTVGNIAPYILPVSACIEDRSRYEIARFEFGRPVTEILEQEWLDFFSIANERSTDDLEPLERALRGLKMDLKQRDAVSRLGRLRQDLMKVLDTYNMDWALDEEPKLIVKHVVDALEPSAFRARVQKHLERQANKHLLKDVVAFFAWATEAHKSFMQWGQEDDAPKTRDKSDRASKPKQTNGSRPDPPPSKDASDQGSTSGHGAQLPKRSCLKCHSTHHRVLECDKCAPGEAQRLLDQWRAKRKQDAVKTRRAGADKEGWSLAVIDGCLAVPKTLLDTGADVSLVSDSIVDDLRSMGRVVTVDKAPTPLTLLPVGGNKLTVTDTVTFERVQLQSSAGPVVVKRLTCWVQPNDGDRILTIGRPVMEVLGYDSERLLAEATGRSREYDMTLEEHDPSAMAKACRVRTAEWQGADAGGIDSADELVMTPECRAPDNAPSVRDVLALRVDEARANGLSDDGVQVLSDLLDEFADVFRVAFGNDPPVAIEPLRVRLKPDATPIKCSTRRYAPLHREYMEQHVAELEAAGLVFTNHRSRWCSAPRIVAKKNPGEYRMTVDVRGVNARTEPMPWPMPILEVVMDRLAGAKVFFSLDWFRGYWQLPLHPESQELFTFMTSRGMVTPTRVLMGCTDAVAFCQGAVEQIFGELLYRTILAWLDDILGYATDEEQLLKALRQVLEACQTYGLRLHPGKCAFFQREVVWCGKVISEQGISHCPKRIEGLTRLQQPKTAAELQQFLCAMNWMRASIPEYNQLVSPLSQLLEDCMKTSKSRKKTQLARVQLVDHGWNQEREQDLNKCKDALQAMVPLAHPREDRVICVYTDASMDFWGAIVTQTDDVELSKPIHEQQHQPLAFLSGAFVGAAQRWPIVEKEAYAIVETCKRLDYLLLRPSGFRLFTDHRNLIYIFHPEATDSNIARYQADKLQRWAMTLTGYRYVVEHVGGEDNVWGDLLSRWGASPPGASPVVVRALMRVPPVSPLQDNDFAWPTMEEVIGCQREQPQEDQDRHRRDDAHGALVNEQDRVWIPDDALDLQQRLCVVAHAGVGGHRGIRTTTATIEERFVWTTLDTDVKRFVQECLQCLSVNGVKEPRPLAATLRASKPNELLHFDFLTLPLDRDTEWRYVLVMKDGLSGFVELHGSRHCTAEDAASALLSWFARYGIVHTWVSDQGAHFKNEVMDQLRRTLGAQHHFVTAYSPWANGTVEVVNRQLLRVLRAVLVERRMRSTQWSTVLPLAQIALNHQPADRLGGVAPVTAFLGLPPTRPLDALFSAVATEPIAEEALMEKIGEHVRQTADALAKLHGDVAMESDARREQARGRRNKKQHVKQANFDVGDFVLAAAVATHGDKLLARWQGPKRIVSVINDQVFGVQDLLPPFATKTHHATRLRFYSDGARDVTQDLQEHIRHTQGTYLVRELVDLRVANDGTTQIYVHWDGFDDCEGTWEPVDVIASAVPSQVRDFCLRHIDNPLAHTVLQDLEAEANRS